MNRVTCAVHPRGHGEHSTFNFAPPKTNGSSPWARGTRLSFPVLVLRVRFIPVGTGNTVPMGVGVSFIAVHPRGHGEHHVNTEFVFYVNGSSPWARGTLARVAGVEPDQRFIPVGTGNTDNFKNEAERLAVHPRGHGEHNYPTVDYSRLSGSSPWARGTLFF